jgi:NAD(P)-dependent dehydrogenase (short-subunit alcohol dehydrogenase family)
MELSIKGVKKGAILITGASSGIGKATALYLSHRGYHVFAGVRKEQQAEDLTKETSSEIQPVILDVTQRDQILAVIDRISDYTRSTRTGLVGVINNAGIAISGPLEFIPQEQLREQFQVSVFGQLAVVQAALPLLRQEAGRIINIGTGGCHLAPPFLGPYVAAKIAMEALNDVLRRELHAWGIHVINIAPGAIDTPLWEKGMSNAMKNFHNLPEKARYLYQASFEKGLALMGRFQRRAIPPDVVARTIGKALESKCPRLHYHVGTGALVAFLIPRIVPQRVADMFVAIALNTKPSSLDK